MIRTILMTAVLMSLLVVSVQPAAALDDEHWAKADEAIEKGIAYLRTTQNEDGSWSPRPGPAITAMVVANMLDRPDIGPDDPAVAKAIDYILSKVKDDGGIHDGFLENYNTAICLTALARVNHRPDVAEAIGKAQQYLRRLQWDGQQDPEGKVVDESHPFYGGAGYGNHGRPDMSNTQLTLEGLHDSGLDCNDPAFQRAVVFISRCQGVEGNEMFGDRIVQDGGFIYATSIDKDNIGVPETKVVDESEPEAGAVSRLRTYGSMTYAGLKSYIYANLDRDDPRVVAAYNWIRAHYTLDQNPGMPEAQKLQGLYYYYMTFARAMNAWGTTTITTADGETHDWANDVIAALVARQDEDGSWINEEDRWYESDRNLVTAYALTALIHAVR